MHRRFALVLSSLALAGSGPALSSNSAHGALETAATAGPAIPSSWARIATRDIERAHAIIQDAHPAVLDPTDTAFHQWFDKGYIQAMDLARRARSEDQAHVALRFYTTGYRDGHLAAWATNPPHTTPQWAGWLLQWRGGAYRVSARSAQWPVSLPQVGDEALSCDGRPINDLLAEKVAPFVDRLMHLDGTRSRLAKHLTLEASYPPLWEPLRPRQCEIRSATGDVRSFPLRWQPAQGEDALILRGPMAPRQGARQLRPGVHWVHASNFMPSSPRALAALEVTLEKIQRMRNAQAVVLDTRGNAGGNSLWGHRILQALFEEAFAPGPARQAPQAYWRVSETASKAFEERKNWFRQAQGEDSEAYLYTQSELSRMQEAASRGEQFIEQAGISRDSRPERTSSGSPFSGKLILVTDADCMSACLKFVDQVLQIPGTVHVGSMTGADTRYTDVADIPLSDTTTLRVPLKVWRHFERIRQDNMPYVPQFIFDGDLTDTAAVQAWVLDSILPDAGKVRLD